MAKHIPVMLNEVMHYLAPSPGETYIDCTFGAGGYSKAILNATDCNLYAIDRDPDVAEDAKDLNKLHSNFKFIQGSFGNLKEIARINKIEKIDAIILDLGVSSMQLDQGDRGFSFMQDADLDMRMSKSGKKASDLINEASEEEIANIIYKYGEEHFSRRIARKIILKREEKPITRTAELASIVRSAVKKSGKIDSATKTFQALRIWVNDELDELEQVLAASRDLLTVGGRLIVVSFHSLEDSIVKTFLNEQICKNKGTSRYLPSLEEEANPVFKLIAKKAVKPTEEEIKQNIRSRSSRMRAAMKIRGAND